MDSVVDVKLMCLLAEAAAAILFKHCSTSQLQIVGEQPGEYRFRLVPFY